jgi:hypothetical protein
MDEKAQLDDLVHAIKKGRMKHSLHLTVVLLVGFGILNFLFGNGIYWLFSQAWISYATMFAFSYFVIWPIKLGRAKKEIGEKEVETIVSSQGTQDNSWMLAALILAALFALTLLKNQSAGEAEEQVDVAAVDMKIVTEREEEITLKIPQSYIKDEGGEAFGMSFTEGGQPESVMLSAKLDDIGLHPIFGEQEGGEDIQQAPYDEHQISPRTNPEMVAIEMSPTQIKIDEELIEDVFDKMTRGAGLNVPVREEAGLNVRSTRVKLPDTKIKGFVEVDEVKLGVPIDPAMQHMFVACENKICMLRANIDGVSDASVYFHPSMFDEWEQIYWKADQLMRGFVKEPDDLQ